MCVELLGSLPSELVLEGGELGILYTFAAILHYSFVYEILSCAMARVLVVGSYEVLLQFEDIQACQKWLDVAT